VGFELGGVGEVDQKEAGLLGVGAGFFGEVDDGLLGAREIEILDIGGGGAEQSPGRDGASETKGGVFGVLVLMVAIVVALVDDDEAKLLDRGEKGGAGADDNLGGWVIDDLAKESAALGRSELGMEEDGVGDIILDFADELGREGDFRNEEDGGMTEAKLLEQEM